MFDETNEIKTSLCKITFSLKKIFCDLDSEVQNISNVAKVPYTQQRLEPIMTTPLDQAV
jgi:hypothetical protein